MVVEGRAERETRVEAVEGREKLGRVVPGRWAHAPSSVGTGRSVGKVVSVFHVRIRRTGVGKEVDGDLRAIEEY